MGIEAEAPRMGIRDEATFVANFRESAAGRLALGMRTRAVRFGLRRELALEIEQPFRRFAMSARPARDADLDRLLAGPAPADERMMRELAATRRFARTAGGAGAFVAIDERNGTPCYLAWLLGPNEASKLGDAPALAAGEMLLAQPYAPQQYRRAGLMPAAVALIAERGGDAGASRVLSFVDANNITWLKGYKSAGFFPYLVHTRRTWLYGSFCTDRFDEMDAGDPRRTWSF